MLETSTTHSIMLDYQDNGVILIVDDNSTNLAVLSQSLKAAGYKIRVAIDGESALEQIRREPPDLILLDIQMPGINGFETCGRLKANPKTLDIPVIFITASSGTENIVKGLSLGAVDYITKPFQREEVLARVRVHLQLRFLTRMVQKQAIALQRANLELERLANLDGLTQVANRRCFDEHLAQEWEKSIQTRLFLSLILCDIDYFKRYNDHYGHQAGDSCLKKVAKAIEASIRYPTDLVARYGGEEFAILLSNATLYDAIQVAKLIQFNVKSLEIPHMQSEVNPFITVSLGVSSQIPIFGTESSSLIAAADQALYTAKKHGRDHYHPELVAV